MPRTLLVYVSGHGFGHARRMAQTLRALLAIRPDLRIHVRTAAPGSIFTAAGIAPGEITRSSLDTGMVEASLLSIDGPGTIRRVSALLDRAEELIAAERAVAEEIRPDLVVSDLPFLAGDVARSIGVACIGHGNFTWDWIYEPYCRDDPRARDLPGRIAASYGKMECVLRLPIAHPMPMFPRVIDMPLVATLPAKSKEEVLRDIEVAGDDDRPRVLVALRGGSDASALVRAAGEAPDLLFIALHDVPGEPPANVRIAKLGAALDFSDVLGASDVVLSKLGYGILADATAAGTALLWPRREGFREDQISETQCPRWLRMRELPIEDFTSGRWPRHVRELLATAAPPEKVRVDGAACCAQWLDRRLG